MDWVVGAEWGRFFKRTQIFQWIDSVAAICACRIWGDKGEDKSGILPMSGIKLGSLLSDFLRLPSPTVDWDRNKKQLQCCGKS